jgi:4-methyl-5(b-hydroxyethyl)-thiazole monophosphate biosynthesis
MKKVVVFFANGFEEIEAITPVDILRRGGCEVTLAGLGEKTVTGAHEIRLTMDQKISEIEITDFDLLVLPGGLPGATNLAQSHLVQQHITTLLQKGGKVAAICAGPWILDSAQALGQRKYTCYPGCEDKIKQGTFTGADVEVDGNIITSRGVGTALPFSFRLLEELGLTNESTNLQKATLVN